MASDTLTVIDNRTGRQYEIPIKDGTIPSMELRKIKASADDFGLMTYDPAFMNTANCRSAITYIDGDQGILRYRGYPIEELAESKSFLQVAWSCPQRKSTPRGRWTSRRTRWCTRTSRS